MNEAEHRRAFEDLPDMRHESPEYGMLPPETPWEPPDGDVVLEHVPDFDQGVTFLEPNEGTCLQSCRTSELQQIPFAHTDAS